MMEPNRMLDEVRLAAVQPLDGGFVLDMGRNYTGWFELALPDNVKRGTKIALEFADKPLPKGKFQTYGQRSVYVARGGGGERFRNRFNYAAFRYATVKGLPRAPQPEEVRGWLVSTNYEAGATFSCDHRLLNKIHGMMCWTYKCLSLGGYTVDCPHRERLGYGGDSGTSMEMGMLNFRTGPFYAKWAADWRDAQNEQGDVPYTAPYSQDAGGGPVWSGFCITMPWQVYLTYGDRRPLVLGWPVMQKWLAFIDTKLGDGLLQSYVGIGCARSPSGTSSATGCRREESRVRIASTTVPPSSSTTATSCTACSLRARSAASWVTTRRPRSTRHARKSSPRDSMNGS